MSRPDSIYVDLAAAARFPDGSACPSLLTAHEVCRLFRIDTTSPSDTVRRLGHKGLPILTYLGTRLQVRLFDAIKWLHEAPVSNQGSVDRPEPERRSRRHQHLLPVPPGA